ncbi:MAG: class I SAM-dependent RNA methyltransferase [Caulobacterales bacterium]
MKRFDRTARGRKPAAPAASGGERAPAPRPVARVETLVVTEVGARGDAVAEGAEGPIYIPYGLPGERVSARVAGDRADILEVLSASSDRQAPACAHFGACGGCQLQHWRDASVLAWKREQVIKAFARRGLETPVDPIIDATAGGRRRAAFHAARSSKGVRFGFMARGSARLLAVSECPALAPALEAALPALREIAALFAPARGEITMPTLLSDSGLDVSIKGAGQASDMDAALFERVVVLLDKFDIARLSLTDETILSRRTPVVSIGRARVTPPPAAFLQATKAGEEALTSIALAAVAGARRTADLFCGLGTFALRLAETSEVLAVEGDVAMLAALSAAADGTGGALKTITTQRRDLLRTPISALELKHCDAIVFDPPRSGARQQAEQIARSKAERVAAVACDPATLARDVRVLVDAGFRLVRVTPIDQFRWSPHVEIVAALER